MVMTAAAEAVAVTALPVTVLAMVAMVAMVAMGVMAVVLLTEGVVRPRLNSNISIIIGCEVGPPVPARPWG